jgi:hypothetical protein
MARGFGYGYLSRKSLIAFREELTQEAWRSVPAVIEVTRKLPEDTSGLSFYSLGKLLIIYAIDDLIEVMGPEDVVLLDIDGEWDDLQRDLDFELTIKERKGTAEEKADAQTAKPILLPDGLRQTGYEASREVEFGKSQVAIARSDKTAPLVARLGLTDLINKIEQKTIALEALHKRSLNEQENRESPSQKRKRLIATAAAVINDVHSFLDRIQQRTPPGNPKETVDSLLTPFLELLKRAEPPPPKTTRPTELTKATSTD